MSATGQGPIDFAGGQASGEEELAGGVPRTINLLVDETGTMRVRPGIAAWSDFPATAPDPSPVEAMVSWGGYLVYVTHDRKLWALMSPGNVAALSSATASTQLDGATRPVALATKSRIVVAGGGAPQKWEGAGTSSRLLGNNTSPPLPTPPSPPATTHLVSVSTRLVAADRSLTGAAAGIIYWSNPLESGNEVWDPINFIELAARPDPVIALYDNSNEVFGFGTSTLQIVRPDPTTGLFVPSVALNVGLSAPYSPVRYDEGFAWLADRRRFVSSAGRGYQETSTAIRRTLDGFATINDAWGFELLNDQWRQVCWHFPTEGRTLTWHPPSGRWGEFRGWSANAGYQPLGISSAYLWDERKLPLVGLPDGRIGVWSAAANTDLGTPIKAEAVSGFQARGTTSRKWCKQVSLEFRRGDAAQGATAPTVQLSWRDDTGAWGQPVTMTLGSATDRAPIVRFRSLGVYRTRQWRLEFADAAPLTFVGASEEWEVLDS